MRRILLIISFLAIFAGAAFAQNPKLDKKLNDDVERYRLLLNKREIAQQQFDQATAAAIGANSTVDARRASLLAAEQQVLVAKARVEQANAELRNAQITPKQVEATKAKAESAAAQALRSKAALDQAQLNLGYTTIVAPVDGIVGKRSVDPGQNVSPGQDLMAVVPLRDIWVTANFKETQLTHMQPGQPVRVKVDTYGGRKSASSGERHRQLCESRAAHPGAHRLRRQRQARFQQGWPPAPRNVCRA